MHVNNLPTDCLNVLFAKFSLQELIYLRAVCTHWKLIIENEICPPKRSLKLFSSFDGIIHYSQTLNMLSVDDCEHLRLQSGAGFEDDLIIAPKYMDLARSDFIFGLFPNVQQIVVFFDPESPFDVLLYLLEQWTGLTSLSIAGCLSGQCDTEKLCQVITSFQSLTRLEVLSSCFFETPIDGMLSQVLPNLEHFTLNGYDDIVPILEQMTSCRGLRLDWIDFSEEDLRKVIQVNEKLPTNVVHLRLLHFDEKNIRFICENFTQLESLDIDIQIPLDYYLLNDISKLKKLTELRLTNIRIDFDDQLPSELKSLPKLSTVKTLHLFPVNKLTGDQFTRVIKTIFPNINKLIYKTVFDDVASDIRECRKEFPKCQVQIRRIYSNEDAAQQTGRHCKRYLNNFDEQSGEGNGGRCKDEKNDQIIKWHGI